ncbi:MAG: DUF2157 domain-containing protein [Paludibacteraceae bacterium]|nr:DUF2157 domain-containing protein [Paludibacteraceae bacterium]
MKIKIDTDELVKRQVISQETADGIIQYYDSSKNISSSKYALSIVAAVFVISGIAILIADSWRSVGLNAHIFFSILPIIGASALSYFVDCKLSDKKVFTESVTILQCVAIFLTFFMMLSTFNLKVNEPITILVSVLACFPFVIYFKATIAATVITIVAAFTMVIDGAERNNSASCIFTYLILAIDIFYLYKTYFKDKEQLMLNIRLFISPFVLTAFFFHLCCMFSNHVLMPNLLIPLIVSCYGFTFVVWNKAKQWLETRVNWIELGSFVLSFIVLTLGVSTHFYDSKIQGGFAIIPSVLPLILLWIFQYKKSIKIQIDQYFCLVYAKLVASTAPILIESTSNLYAILLLIFLAYHTYRWTKSNNVLFFNIGMLCWIIAIANIADLRDFNPSVVAVWIIFWGIILLAINYYLIKKRKSHGIEGDK